MIPSSVTASPRPTEQTPLVSHTIREIQAHIGGEVAGEAETVITGVNALELAQPGELTFAEGDKYAPQVRRSRASAFIVPPGFPAVAERTLVRVDHPRLAFLKALYLFQPRHDREPGIHPSAVVAPDAELGEGITIGPCAVVRPRARIGRNTVIESGAHVGEAASIGAECFLGPNVVVMYGCRLGNRVIVHGGTVIGADGFGYVPHEGRHMKIPQLGNVLIEDDVELGANVCVDRATFGSTIIKRGTKVDNLVQIAHNDVIGEDVILAGQVGLAGSVKVGNRVLFGGQAGVADHVTIGDDVRVGGGSIVFRKVPAGQTIWGYPARQLKKAQAEFAVLGRLPKLWEELMRSRRASAQPARKSSRRPATR